MAIIVETLVPRASKAQAHQFVASIEEFIKRSGGPPDGFMAHFIRPEGDGFLLCDVWRSEAEMRPFYDDVALPQLAAGGLEPESARIAPAWSFARS